MNIDNHIFNALSMNCKKIDLRVYLFIIKNLFSKKLFFIK